jgi:hypothetical protein
MTWSVVIGQPGADLDHSLSRLERGLAGFLVAEGEANPAVFHGEASNMSGH